MASSLHHCTCKWHSETSWSELSQMSDSIMRSIPDIYIMLGTDQVASVSQKLIEDIFEKSKTVSADISGILQEWHEIKSDHMHRVEEIGSLKRETSRLQDIQAGLKEVVEELKSQQSTAETRVMELERDARDARSRAEQAAGEQEQFNQRVADIRQETINLEEKSKSLVSREHHIQNLELDLLKRLESVAKREGDVKTQQESLISQQERLTRSIEACQDQEADQDLTRNRLEDRATQLAHNEAAHADQMQNLKVLQNEHNRQCTDLLDRRAKIATDNKHVERAAKIARDLLVSLFELSSTPFHVPSADDLPGIVAASSRMAIRLREEFQNVYNTQTTDLRLQKVKIEDLESTIRIQDLDRERAKSENTAQYDTLQTLVESLQDSIRSQRHQLTEKYKRSKESAQVFETRYNSLQDVLDQWKHIVKLKDDTIRDLTTRCQFSEEHAQAESLSHAKTVSALTKHTEEIYRLQEACSTWIRKTTVAKRELAMIEQKLDDSIRAEKRKYSQLEEKDQETKRTKISMGKRIERTGEMVTGFVEEIEDGQTASEKLETFNTSIQEREHNITLRERELDEVHAKLAMGNGKLKANWKKHKDIVKTAHRIVLSTAVLDAMTDPGEGRVSDIN